LFQKFNHNIVFLEKRQFFRRKLAKIAENCDHNIDFVTSTPVAANPTTFKFTAATPVM
jgi:hypothetical protein